MHGYKKLAETVYRKDEFIEFEATTLSILGKNIPISGGGYLRLFPWGLMKGLLNHHLRKNEIYVLYIHPFELSQSPIPEVPSSTSIVTKFRYSHGRKKVLDRIKKLIELLRSNGYSFTTFSKVQQDLNANLVE